MNGNPVLGHRSCGGHPARRPDQRDHEDRSDSETEEQRGEGPVVLEIPIRAEQTVTGSSHRSLFDREFAGRPRPHREAMPEEIKQSLPTERPWDRLTG
jgi:hypothetical protein